MGSEADSEVAGTWQRQLKGVLEDMARSLGDQNRHIENQIQHLNAIRSLLESCPEPGKPPLQSASSVGEVQKSIHSAHEEEEEAEEEEVEEVEEAEEEEVEEAEEAEEGEEGEGEEELWEEEEEEELDEEEIERRREARRRQTGADLVDEENDIIPADRMSLYRYTDPFFADCFSEVATAGPRPKRQNRLPRELYGGAGMTGYFKIPAQPGPRACTVDWKYWRPAWLGQYAPGRGRPSYLPSWELVQRDEKWYHIDDPPNAEPLLAGPPDYDKRPYTLVPYALSPPGKGERYSVASLRHMEEQLISSLGQLFSVPHDGRVTLRFERNRLRLACEDDQLSSYLREVRELFTALHKGRGFFRVTDFDDLMNSAAYNTCHQIEDVPETDWENFPVGPALAAEEFQLNVPPGLHYSYNGEPEAEEVAWCKGRQWHRLIHCHGLANMSLHETAYHDLPRARNECLKFWKLLFCKKDSFRDGLDLSEDTLDELFNLHVSCDRRQQSYNPYMQDWKAFHITWYRIPTLKEIDRSLWKTGTLYQSNQRLQESAFTIGLFPNLMDEGARDVNRVAPPKLDKTHGNIRDTPVTSPQALVLHLIAEAYKDAADSWEEIARHITKILADDEDAALDAEKHDRLLFDDNTFSRSRLYFWAVDILETFQESIQDSTLQWKYWWSGWEEILRDFEKYQTERVKSRRLKDTEGAPLYPDEYDPLPTIDDIFPRIEPQIRRLEQLDAKFKGLLERTQKLRDGLFSASSVIESRAATDLGENVKLLTYVSIFYMPLGVSAAVWSINADYGLTLFGIVTVIVAIATYVLVANLNNTVQAMQAAFRAFQSWLVKDMMSRPENEYWVEKARGFKQFRPDRANLKPSKWMLLWYLAIKVLRFDFLKGTAKNIDSKPCLDTTKSPDDTEDGTQSDENPSSPAASGQAKRSNWPPRPLKAWGQLLNKSQKKNSGGDDVELATPAASFPGQVLQQVGPVKA
ncbi:hypothetical protein FQN49_006531 [Arthroderma sp. PD_2]|nr:hypothetical protein FQN49_006531 [Arthroderma sp. PD_2]